MKKFVFIILAFLWVSFCSYSQNSDEKQLPELFKYIYELPEFIFGNVKELHVKTYDAIERNGQIMKMGMIVTNGWNQPSSIYFNAKGQIIHWHGNAISGNLNGIFHYDNGSLESIYWLINDSLYFIWNYTYPDKGKVKRMIYDVQKNENAFSTTYDLDNNGFVIKQVDYNEMQNKENNTTIFERRSDGTITDKKVKTPDGKLQGHFDKWEYDEQGKKYKVHRLVEAGEELDAYGPTHTYEFDEMGNWIKWNSVNRRTHTLRVIERKFVYFK